MAAGSDEDTFGQLLQVAPIVIVVSLAVALVLGLVVAHARLSDIIDRRRISVGREADRMWAKYGAEALEKAKARGVKDPFFRAVARVLHDKELRRVDLAWILPMRLRR